ncbi:MAG: glycosyltransferase, partial [Planctomycetota bacterium]
MKLKVAILTGPLEVNDASLLALDLAPALAARGHEVTIYGGPGPMESRIAARGVPIVRAPDPFGILLPKRREWLREIGGADLIHAVDPRQARRGGRLAFLTGRPWVLSVTSVVPSAILDAIHHPAAVLVSCRSARDEFLLSRPAARNRVHVVPPGVDAERFASCGSPLAGEVPIVGTVTAFDAHSGVPDLLRAATG